MSNIEKKKFSLAPKKLEQWQARKEWFFNREHTDRYEDYYEGRYKRAEIWQKKVLAKLIKKDERVETLLEYGCGTTRFTRWWNEIGIEATGADISPFMLGQGNKLFGGDLVWADSHHMPFKDNTFDALMSCPDCKRYFPVIYGIPILIPDEYRDDSLEKPLLKKWGVELQEEDGEQPQLKGGGGNGRITLYITAPYTTKCTFWSGLVSKGMLMKRNRLLFQKGCLPYRFTGLKTPYRPVG